MAAIRAMCGVRQKRQKEKARLDGHAGFRRNCREIGKGDLSMIV